MRIHQSVAFSQEDLIILNEIKEERGRLSNICKKAIREWKGLNQSEEDLKIKLNEIKTSLNTLLEDEKYYKLRLDNLRETDNQQEELIKNNKVDKLKKQFNEELKDFWRKNKITDEDYYKICDIKNLDLKIKTIKGICNDFKVELFFVQLSIYNSKVYKGIILNISILLIEGIKKRGRVEINFENPLIITK